MKCKYQGKHGLGGEKKNQKRVPDGEVVNTGKLNDLLNVAERGTHDNGLVSKLLVVVVDAGDRDNTCAS
jgi:hypothetical protein